MSNKLFRKGLVAAALAGLVASAISGPAHAVVGTQLTVAPAAGTSTTTFVDQNFELLTSFNSGYVPNAYTQLRYQITTDGVNTIDYRTADSTGTASTGLTVDSTTHVGDIASVGATAVSQNFLDLKVHAATSTTATTVVNVVAYVDANNNGKLDSGDSWKTAIDVTFKKYSEVTATPVLTAPFQGDTTVAAKVSFDGLNNEQLATGSVTADVRINGSSITAATATASTNHDYFKLSTSRNIAAADLVYVKATFNGVAVGTAVSATAGTRKVATVDARLVTSADASGTAVRTDKAFVVKAVLTDADAAKLAGLAVTATVTTSASLAAVNTADTTKQLTVAGTTYTAGANLPGGSVNDAVALTSDANGAVTVAISTHNYAAGDTITVVFKSQNLSSNTLTVTETAAVYRAFLGDRATVQTTDGVAASFPVKVYDQYGQPIADGYYAVATWASNGQADAASTTASSTYAAIVGGAATLSILDNGTGVGNNTYNLTVQKRNADGSYAGNVLGSTPTLTSAIVSALSVPATVTVAGFTQDSTSKVYYIGTAASQTAQALNLNDYAAVDTRFSSATEPTVGTGVTVGGNVKTALTASAAAANVQGATVTVAGKGLLFKTVVDSKNVWSLDSASAVTDASGNYSFVAYSNLSGVQTLTVTAGAATATAKIKFAAPAGNTGKTLVITAADSVLPGQNVSFTATLTDKYGNPVNTATATAANSFKFSGTGVGSIATAVTATGDDGVATLTAATGVADSGTITLTAVYSTDGTTANTTTVTKSVKVAAAPAPSAAKTALAVGADQAQVGAAVDVIATATDAAGKAVAGVVVTFDNVGQGYLSATSATTDANGVAKVKLVGNVAGRNTLTATAHGATAANAGVSYGAADANITVKGKRVTVTYEYAGLAKVVVSVNGTRQPAVYPADDNEGTYSFNLKAGTNKIVVSIAGKTVDSKTVKIKK
jgi:hypothetical protein